MSPDQRESAYDLTNPDMPEMAQTGVAAAPDHPLIRGVSTDSMTVEKDVRIPTSDGKYVLCDVFRPRTAGTYPVLLNSGPYGKDIPFDIQWPYEYERSAQQSEYMTIETVEPEVWVADGYAVVRIDQAGTGKSPGVIDVWSPRDTGYYYDAIEWAASQPWSTGKIGLIGVSYYSATQFAVAARRPPHLAAIIPWEVGPDLYRDLVRNGGILDNGFMDFWFEFWVLSNQHGLGSTPNEELQDMFVDFRELIRSHEFFDDFWAERVDDLSKVEVPMFTAANWAGTGLSLRSHFSAFNESSSTHKWLRVHTGGHIEPFYSLEALAEQKRFFDHFLRGVNNGQLDVPPVHLAIRTGSEVSWRYENEWPLSRTDWTPMHLDAADAPTLRDSQPDSEGKAQFSAEPDDAMWAPVTSYNDVLTTTSGANQNISRSFLSAPIDNDMEVTGPVALSLRVSCSAGDTDLFVVIRDIDPSGNEVVVDGVDNPKTPVTFGWLRLSHRELDPERSTVGRPVLRHDAPAVVEPDEIVDVQIEVGPTSWVFQAGHRICIEIGSRDLPGAFPFLHNDKIDRRTGGEVTIYTGPGTNSTLLLPVIPVTGA